jgi:hypothetical protein
MCGSNSTRAVHVNVVVREIPGSNTLLIFKIAAYVTVSRDVITRTQTAS